MKYALIIIALAFSGTVAYADQPEPGQAKVEALLKSEGYTSWKRIDLDSGSWEVDDAINTAGKQFDLRIDASTLKTTLIIPE